IQSNVVADANFIYWTSAGGLMKLSTIANLGDAPQTLSSAIGGISELTQDASFVYALLHADYSIWKINKASGASAQMALTAGNGSLNLQTDGILLYWMHNGDLESQSLANHSISLIDSGVTGYYLVGGGEVIY